MIKQEKSERGNSFRLISVLVCLYLTFFSFSLSLACSALKTFKDRKSRRYTELGFLTELNPYYRHSTLMGDE